MRVPPWAFFNAPLVSASEAARNAAASGHGAAPDRRPSNWMIFSRKLSSFQPVISIGASPSEVPNVNRSAQSLRPFSPLDRDYDPLWKRMKGLNSILAAKKSAPSRRTALSGLRECPFGLSPEHSPAVLNVGFHRTDCQSGPLGDFLVRETFDLQL